MSLQSIIRKSTLAAAFAVLAFVVASAQADSQSTWDNGFHSSRSCESCHVPHAAAGDNTQVPLWSPSHLTTTLTTGYSSPTMDATVGAPDGASALCLSCHDGSYAHVSADHSLGAGEAMGALINSHPVSFVYDAALVAADDELVDPSTLADDVLDGQSKMQCTSCHDIHSTAPFGKSHKEQDFILVNGVKTPVDTNNDGNLTNDLNTNSHDGHYLRWSYASSPAGTQAAFCRNCHLK